MALPRYPPLLRMRLLALLPVLLPLLLVSCIEGEEEIWLEPDGSGRIEATYKMPTVVAQKIGDPDELVEILKNAAARDPHIELTSVSHQTRRGGVTLKFSGTFDDLRKLATFPQRQLRDPAEPDKRVKAEVLFGTTHLDISWRGLSYERQVDISWLLKSSPAAKSIVRVPALLGNSSFRYTLNLPTSARESNSTTQSQDGHKLEWLFPLKNHVQEPMHLTAEGDLPLPGTLWLIPLAVLVLLFLIQNRRARKKLQR
ncbi:MAG: hypothetical protein VYA46_02850 [Verrucomicrobiota bacterium]|nr:hypothetical protein [Verrucomicrobiota bacterium]